MRLGRAAFWRFFLCNAIAVAALMALLPQAARFAPPADRGALASVQPVLVVFALCLPSVWMGMRRLHDVGHSGWQAWLPIIPLGVMGLLPTAVLLVQQQLLAAIVDGQAQNIPQTIGQFGAAVLIGLWLGALLLAAGVLRTVFLWMEPGDANDNRYGPPPEDNMAPAAPAKPLLKGRMQRIIFWPLVLANMASVYGATYVIDHWPEMRASQHDGSPSHPLLAFFYLPAFIAAVLRLHDRNRPGTLALTAFAINAAASFAEPFLNGSEIGLMNVVIDVVTIYLLYQCWQPGDVGDNRYGPPPGEQPPRAPTPAPRPAPARAVGGGVLATRPSSPRGFGRRVS